MTVFNDKIRGWVEVIELGKGSFCHSTTPSCNFSPIEVFNSYQYHLYVINGNWESFCSN